MRLSFNIQSVKASGTIYIRDDGGIDPQTVNITSVDNVTYTFTDNNYDPIVVERDDIVIDGSGYTLQGTQSGTGLDFTGRSNITIRKMEIDAFHYGIWLYASSNINVTGNNITNNHNGIYFAYSSNNTVSENNITDNLDYAVYLFLSSNNTVYKNTVAGNWYYGIIVDSSSYNRISENAITFSPLGIWLFQSSSNTVSKNNIIYIDECAIKLEASNDNSIFGNDVTTQGIWLYESSNNNLYHNNFLDGVEQVHSFDSTNVWDNGVEGNYWSDYTGQDENNDGVGDRSYVIDANNQDGYPLMGMFHDFPIDETHVTVISNSTVSSFDWYIALPVTIALHFNVAGLNDTVGFCRVMIPRAFMKGPYTVSVDGEEVETNELPISNSTHAFLYFTYIHSTHAVVIIPEFSSLFVLPLLMIATLLAVIVYRRKYSM